MGIGSVEDRRNEYYTYSRDRAQSIHEPLDPPDNPSPRLRSVDRLLKFISAFETNLSLLDKENLSFVLWHGSATLNG